MSNTYNEKLGIEKIHHVAFAVPDMDEALRVFRALGFDPLVLDFTDNTEAAFYVGEVQVQFYYGKHPEQRYAKWCAEHGGKMGAHHVCYVVTDLKKTMEAIKEAGMETVETIPGRGTQGIHVQIKPEYTCGCEVEFLELASYLKGKPVEVQNEIVKNNFQAIMDGTFAGIDKNSVQAEFAAK